jgi:hypothetical protein
MAFHFLSFPPPQLPLRAKERAERGEVPGFMRKK